jgi:hypothetical protein
LKVLLPQQKTAATATMLVIIGISLLFAGNLAPAPEPNPMPPAYPFGVGERLVYGIRWNPPLYLFFLPPMEAGQATLGIAGETQYQNRKALKIVFTARSSGILARMVHLTVDDYYEFTTDAETLCTRSVIKREREGKRMRDIDIAYAPDSRKLHLREVDVAGPQPRVLRDKDYEGIPPCVKDLFSALYALRRSRLEVGSKERVLVGDNQIIKEVEIRVLKKERIRTEVGTFDAFQIDTIAVMGGLFKNGGQFRIWLSADERRMPLKFEAKVNLGKVTGILREARAGSQEPEASSQK